MIQTIRVQTTIGPDLQGQGVFSEIQHATKKTTIKNVQAVRIYRLEGVNEKQAKFLSEKLFCESINQVSSLNSPLIKNANQIVEIAYKPGVMNPEIASIIKAAKDLGVTIAAADSSWEYGFFGKINNEEIRNLVEKLKLYNPTVEHVVTTPPTTLLIKGKPGPTTTIALTNMNDADLFMLSKDKLFLNLEEMKVIQQYFQKIKRDPTDIELETLAQTWSEHCAHKTFKAKLIVDGKEKEPLMKRIKKEALKHKKHIVSAFVDNSGVMNFYDGFSICAKVETHNSPSAIEPYGGAMTGSGGVFRDILGTGQGAKPIASTDIFCFTSPYMNEQLLPSGCLPPLYLLRNVIRGVKDYGNRMGIPTNNGSIHFHDDFRAKPTIIVGAYGILPTKQAQKGQAKVNDIVVAVGGRTGRDGIHGATFSSAEMTDRTINVNSSAVQIGNAIEEKRMFDAILEARDLGLIRAMQDCGAGGFSSAIGEIGSEIGVDVHLEKTPLKYQGLSPWEIWVSESQERMTLAIPKEKLNKFLEVCKKYNVEACSLGVFTNTKKLKVFFDKKLICDLDMEFLHNGLPQRTMIAKSNNKEITNDKKTPAKPATEKEWIANLEKVLSHGNINSKEPIIRRYDHTVQGTNVLQPFSGELLDGPNDAMVIRPLLSKPYGMVVSHGLNPVLNTIDPYWGSMWAATESLSNYVSAGGNYKDASLINNYIWPFPDEESLWSLDRSVDAVVDFMNVFSIPVISGKDSLSSTYRSKDGTVIKIPPVLCISVFGKIPDVTKTMSSDFKKTNSLIYLIGNLDIAEMGGSTYYDTHNILGNNLPKVDIKMLPKIFSAITDAIQGDSVLSVHDVSEGGLITAIFEMCVGGNNGADILLDNKNRLDFFLFNETAGTFIVEVENEKIAAKLFKNIPHILIGKTKKETAITVLENKKQIFSVEINKLKQAWQKPMKEIFG